MSRKHATYFNWSSGKDAAMALYHLQRQGDHNITRLLTTVNSHHDRVSMHGLRRSLLERQAAAVGITLSVLELPEQPSMDEYNQIMEDCLSGLKMVGYTHCGFGDIFLEDLKEYREKQLAAFGITGTFPLWKRDTTELIKEFLSLGFKAVDICANGELLDETFVGRELDESFLRDLPDNVDPCGENGEFHTFCYDGPIFLHPVEFSVGEKVHREYDSPDGDGKKTGFWFCDLVPVED